MIRTLAYKAYVIGLMLFVIWAGKLFYSLIYWEFEYKGVDTKLYIGEKEPELSRQMKIRDFLDNHSKTRSYDLGDVVIKEQYEEGHFHHVGQTLNEPVFNGCDYCHTNIPHQKDEEARAFRNMHGYFLACETCHFIRKYKPNEIEYSWLNIANKEATVRPLGLVPVEDAGKPGVLRQVGNYGARVAPWVRNNRDLLSIVSVSSQREAKEIFESFEEESPVSLKKKMNHVHRGLTKKPLTCNACHSKKQSILSYRRLGYSKKESAKLMDTAVASVISKYNKFHFPDLFIRKDDRKNSATRP